MRSIDTLETKPIDSNPSLTSSIISLISSLVPSPQIQSQTQTIKTTRPLPFPITIATESTFKSIKKPFRVYTSAGRKGRDQRPMVLEDEQEKKLESSVDMQTLDSSSTLVASSSMSTMMDDKMRSESKTPTVDTIFMKYDGPARSEILLSEEEIPIFEEKSKKGSKRKNKKKKKTKGKKIPREKRGGNQIEEEIATDGDSEAEAYDKVFGRNREGNTFTPDNTLVTLDQSFTSAGSVDGEVDLRDGSDDEALGGRMSSSVDEIQDTPADRVTEDGIQSEVDGESMTCEATFDPNPKYNSPSTPVPEPESDSDTSESSDHGISPFATKNIFARLALDSSTFDSKDGTSGGKKGAKAGKQLWSTTASFGSETEKVGDSSGEAMENGIKVEIEESSRIRGDDAAESPPNLKISKSPLKAHAGGQSPSPMNQSFQSEVNNDSNALEGNFASPQGLQQDSRRGGGWHQQPYRRSFAQPGRGTFRGGSPSNHPSGRPPNFGPHSPLQGAPNGDSTRPVYHATRYASGPVGFPATGGGGNEHFDSSRRPLGPAALRRKQEVEDAELAKNPIDGSPMYVLAEFNERPNYNATLFFSGISLSPELSEVELRFQLLRHLQSFTTHPNAVEKIRIVKAHRLPEYVAFVTFLTTQDAEAVLHNPKAAQFQTVPPSGTISPTDQLLHVEKTSGQRTLWIHVVGKRESKTDFTANDSEVLPQSYHLAPKSVAFHKYLDRAGYHQDGILKVRLRAHLCLDESYISGSRAEYERQRRAAQFMGNPVWEPAGKTVVSMEGADEAEIIRQCCEVFGGIDHVIPWHNTAQGGYEVQFWDRESAIRCCNQLRLLNGVVVWWASEKETESSPSPKNSLAAGSRDIPDPTPPRADSFRASNGARTVSCKPPMSDGFREDFPALPRQANRTESSFAASEMDKTAGVPTEHFRLGPAGHFENATEDIEVDLTHSNTSSVDYPNEQRVKEESFEETTSQDTASPTKSSPLVFGDPNSTLSPEIVLSHPIPQTKNGRRNKLGLTTSTHGLRGATSAVLDTAPPSTANNDEHGDPPLEAFSAAERERSGIADQVQERLTMVLTGLDTDVETLDSVRERCRGYGRITKLEFSLQKNGEEAICSVSFSSYVATKLAIAAENGRVVNGRVQRATSRWNFLRGGDEPMTTPSPPITRSQVVLPGNNKNRSTASGSRIIVEISKAPPAPTAPETTESELSPSAMVSSSKDATSLSSGTISALPLQARDLHKKVSFVRSASRRRALSDPGSPGLKRQPSIDLSPSSHELISPELLIVREKASPSVAEDVAPVPTTAEAMAIASKPASTDQVQQLGSLVYPADPLSVAPLGGMPGYMPYYWPMPIPYPMPYIPGDQFPTTPAGGAPNLFPPYFGVIPPHPNSAHSSTPSATTTPVTASTAPRIPGNRPSLSNLRSPTVSTPTEKETSPDNGNNKSSLQPLSYLQGPQGLVAVYDSDELTQYRKENKIPDDKEEFVEDKSNPVTLLPLSSGGHSPLKAERKLPPIEATIGAQSSTLQHGPPGSFYQDVPNPPSSESQASETDINLFGAPVIGSSYLHYDAGGDFPPFYGSFEHPPMGYASTYQGFEQPQVDLSVLSPAQSFAHSPLQSIMRPGSHAALYGLGVPGQPSEEYQQAPVHSPYKHPRGSSSAPRSRGGSTYGHHSNRQASNKTLRYTSSPSNVAQMYPLNSQPAMEGFKGQHQPQQPLVYPYPVQLDVQNQQHRVDPGAQSSTSGRRFAYNSNQTASATPQK